MTTLYATNWNQADQMVNDLATSRGIEKVLYGSGRPCSDPCVVHRPMDAWSGEGMGYNVSVYPSGQSPCSWLNGDSEHLQIRIRH